MRVLRVGTRGSRLARTQTEGIVRRLTASAPGREFEIVELRTEGDRDRSTALAELPGVGLFTKSIERALAEDRCDIAVHSLKDLPVAIDARFLLGAIPKRVDPADVIVGPAGLAGLPDGARLGTGSPRRAALALSERPDLDIVPLRGNVDTRLGKLDSGDVDALVLAAAGLERLGAGVARHRLDPTRFCPSPGQGALGVECRADDDDVLGVLAAIDHGPTRLAVEAERCFLAALGGGCSMPIGAFAQVDGELMTLYGVVVAPGGRDGVRDRWQGPSDAGEAGARELAEWMLAQGAAGILEGLIGRDEPPAVAPQAGEDS